MSNPRSRDEALNFATLLTIVIACLVSGAAIGMSLWTVMSKLL